MKRKIKLTILIMLVIIGLNLRGVQANYQSSPNVSATINGLETWMIGVRQMEASGQVMGLNETIYSDCLCSQTGRNNIDVHLQKNTEYGAMLILAVSDYGKQGNGIKGSDNINTSTYGLATTTGNVSGVYNVGNYGEWVAAGLEAAFPSFTTNISYSTNIFKRYANRYTTTETGLRGDAMLETKNWQSSGHAAWITSAYPAIYRGGSGYKAFAYGSDQASKSYKARAVVVSGSGF